MPAQNPGFGTSPQTVYELTHDYSGTGGASGYPDSDGILFQNQNGQIAVWEPANAGDNPALVTLVTENALGPNPGTNWHALLSGGFGLPGAGLDNADTVLQNSATGAIQIWTTNTNLNNQPFPPLQGPDIATSQLNVLLAGGGGQIANPGSNWQLVGLGEFNGVQSDPGNTGMPSGLALSGAPDMLFQNSQTGAISEWYISQGSTAGVVIATPESFLQNNTDTTWKVVGTNDFAGQTAAAGQAGVDGNTITSAPGTGEQYDIWFQNTVTGQVGGWHVGGQGPGGAPVVTQYSDLATPGPNWHLVSTDGYFGGNIGGDLLFQNVATGNIGVWQMTEAGNTSGLQTAVVSAMHDVTVGGSQNTDPTWVLLGAGDYSGNGGHTNTSTDLLFQNSSTGAVAVWVGNDTPAFAAGANVVLDNPGTSWHATHVQDALLNA